MEEVPLFQGKGKLCIQKGHCILKTPVWRLKEAGWLPTILLALASCKASLVLYSIQTVMV